MAVIDNTAEYFTEEEQEYCQILRNIVRRIPRLRGAGAPFHEACECAEDIVDGCYTLDELIEMFEDPAPTHHGN